MAGNEEAETLVVEESKVSVTVDKVSVTVDEELGLS